MIERAAAVLNRIERARKQSIQALRTVFNTYCSKAACGPLREAKDWRC